MFNKETHTRFWVTLTNEEFTKLSEDAKELNLSVSAFARQIVTDYLHKEDTRENSADRGAAMSPAVLNEKIMRGLSDKEVGEEFSIKELFLGEWSEMNRSEKAIAAKILASIERSSHNLEICDVRNKTSIYKKI